jgi:hypothetical protein
MEPDNQEAYEERAAIMEFDAGMSRENAERNARKTLSLLGCCPGIPLNLQTPGYLRFRNFREQLKGKP